MVLKYLYYYNNFFKLYSVFNALFNNYNMSRAEIKEKKKF